MSQILWSVLYIATVLLKIVIASPCVYWGSLIFYLKATPFIISQAREKYSGKWWTQMAAGYPLGARGLLVALWDETGSLN